MEIREKDLVFFDMEFTGLHSNTELLSLGAVTESGKVFYGEITDHSNNYSTWIEENILSNLLKRRTNLEFITKTNTMVERSNIYFRHTDSLSTSPNRYMMTTYQAINLYMDEEDKHPINVIIGPQHAIMTAFLSFLASNNIKNPVLVTDVGHYDMMLMVKLFGDNALDIPFSPAYYDINQMMLMAPVIVNGPVCSNMVNAKYMDKAFNITRSQLPCVNNDLLYNHIYKSFSTLTGVVDISHNALLDALMVRAIYNAFESSGEYDIDPTIKMISDYIINQ